MGYAAFTRAGIVRGSQSLCPSSSGAADVPIVCAFRDRDEPDGRDRRGHGRRIPVETPREVVVDRRPLVRQAWAVALLGLTIIEFSPLPWRARDVLPTQGHRWLAGLGTTALALDCRGPSLEDSGVPWLMQEQARLYELRRSTGAVILDCPRNFRHSDIPTSSREPVRPSATSTVSFSADRFQTHASTQSTGRHLRSSRSAWRVSSHGNRRADDAGGG